MLVVGTGGVRAALGVRWCRLLVEIEPTRLVMGVGAFGVALKKYFYVVRELSVLEKALCVVEGLWTGATCKTLVGWLRWRPVLVTGCFENLDSAGGRGRFVLDEIDDV